MADIPVLRGWADETANIPQAIQGIISAFNPKFPLQLQLMQHVSDPDTLQKYADLEAQNPGITQQIFGQGRGTAAILNTGQSAKGQIEQGSRSTLKSDPAALQESVAGNIGAKTPVERKLQDNQVKLGTQGLQTGALNQQAIQQELTSKGIELATQQRGTQILQSNPKLDYHSFQALPAADQNAVLSTPMGKSLMDKQIIAEQRALQTRETWAMRESMSAEARAAAQAQSQAARRDLFTTRSYMDLMGQGLKGASIKDVDTYLNGGGSEALQAAMKSPDAAKLLQSPQFAPMLAISNAMGNKGGAKIAANLDPQIDAMRKVISNQITPPKSMGKNSKQIPADFGSVMPNVQRLQDLYYKQSQLSGGPLRKVLLDRVGGKVSLREYNSTGDQTVDKYAAMKPQDRLVAMQKLKAQNPDAYKYVFDALTKVGSL